MASGGRPGSSTSLELYPTTHGGSMESTALLQGQSGSSNVNYVEMISSWTFLENAAKARYGQRILVLKTTPTLNAIDQFFGDFQFSVLFHDPEPRETRHTIVDIHNKEYLNRSNQERDETLVKLSKPGSLTQGNRYHFTPTSGILFNFDEDIGSKIVGLAAVGGSLGVREGDKATGQHHSMKASFDFQYQQEEKISVPPRTKVKAKITTSTIKYEMGYTLEVKIPSSRFVMVTYRTSCQTFLCGLCRNIQPVYAADMLRHLPNYREENGWCFFHQVGMLTWIGENCTVEKTEEPL